MKWALETTVDHSSRTVKNTIKQVPDDATEHHSGDIYFFMPHDTYEQAVANLHQVEGSWGRYGYRVSGA
jgi:hypothetical protein